MPEGHALPVTPLNQPRVDRFRQRRAVLVDPDHNVARQQQQPEVGFDAHDLPESRPRSPPAAFGPISRQSRLRRPKGSWRSATPPSDTVLLHRLHILEVIDA